MNVTFHATNNTTQYIAVGGTQVWTNYIHAHLRPRGADKRAKLNELVRETMRIWDKEIRMNEDARSSGRLDDDKALHNVFVMEALRQGQSRALCCLLRATRMSGCSRIWTN